MRMALSRNWISSPIQKLYPSFLSHFQYMPRRRYSRRPYRFAGTGYATQFIRGRYNGKASSSFVRNKMSSRTCTITDTEFISDIAGSVNWAKRKDLNLNPRNAQCFPWLAAIAPHFQEFRFRKLRFFYTPTSGSSVNNVNPALGSVNMAISYNTLVADPANKSQLLQLDGAETSAPCNPLSMNVRVKHPVMDWLYMTDPSAQLVNSNVADQVYDARFSSLGTFYLGVVGQPGNDGVLGELRVQYTVELRKPIIPEMNVRGMFCFALFVFSTFR